MPAAAEAKFGGRVLKMGASGGDVKTLQRLLTQAGFTTSIDGAFGSGTRDTVMSWEASAERKADGRVTRPDARALKRDAASSASEGSVPQEEPVDDETIDADADNEVEPTAGGTSYVDIAPGQINDDGTAAPPTDAPDEVADIIDGGNKIHDLPYKWGGGHGKWKDSGYDCSGSVSYALHAAGLLDTPLDSTGLESYGEPGRGTWVTIYANAEHTYMVVAGMRFDTSAAKAQSNGSRWSDDMRHAAGNVVRQPPGL